MHRHKQEREAHRLAHRRCADRGRDAVCADCGLVELQRALVSITSIGSTRRLDGSVVGDKCNFANDTLPLSLAQVAASQLESLDLIDRVLESVEVGDARRSTLLDCEERRRPAEAGRADGE